MRSRLQEQLPEERGLLMLNILTRLADRMVEMVAPSAVAAAGCSSTPYQKSCGCTSTGFVKTKTCQLDFYCHETCGSCNKVTSIHC